MSDATGKPILTATELAVADPDNPGPAAVRASGRLCYPSGNRAVTALGHLYRYARDCQRRRDEPADRALPASRASPSRDRGGCGGAGSGRPVDVGRHVRGTHRDAR